MHNAADPGLPRSHVAAVAGLPGIYPLAPGGVIAYKQASLTELKNVC